MRTARLALLVPVLLCSLWVPSDAGIFRNRDRRSRRAQPAPAVPSAEPDYRLPRPEPSLQLRELTFPVVQPQGWFVFRSAEGPIVLDPAIAKNPNIAGWILREKWSYVQPTNTNRYELARLTRAAEQVGQQGLWWQLEILAAESAPKWTGGYGAQFNPAYRQAYEKLWTAVAARFAKDPKLVAVHCTLPMDTSPEFKLKSPLDQANWKKKAITVNVEALSLLKRLFPRQVIVIDLHNPVNAQDGYVADQIRWAKETLGKRCCLQENGWNSKPEQVTYNLYQAVKAHAAAGYPAGLEQVMNSANTARWGTGSLQDGVKYLKQAGVQYGIIYAPDAAAIGPFPTPKN